MAIALGLLILAVVIWFFMRSGDSSYDDMAENLNQEAEAQTQAYLERERKKEEEAKAAKQKEALKKAKYALIDHPKYGTIIWSGRGRKPKNLVQYLEEGGSLEDLKLSKDGKILESDGVYIRREGNRLEVYRMFGNEFVEERDVTDFDDDTVLEIAHYLVEDWGEVSTLKRAISEGYEPTEADLEKLKSNE